MKDRIESPLERGCSLLTSTKKDSRVKELYHKGKEQQSPSVVLSKSAFVEYGLACLC